MAYCEARVRTPSAVKRVYPAASQRCGADAISCAWNGRAKRLASFDCHAGPPTMVRKEFSTTGSSILSRSKHNAANLEPRRVNGLAVHIA